MISPNTPTTAVDPSSSPFPLPMLVTGAAGVAGFNAFRYFRQKYGAQVIGQRPVNNWPLRGPGIEACDLDDRRSVRQLIEKYRFRSVLSCGGSCALKSCELDPVMAERVNVIGLQMLLDAIAPTLPRLVHLSVDLVFSGTAAGDHVESDPTDPVTVYGKTMVEGEKLVTAQRPDACILRISLPMGVSFNGHAGAIDWIQSRFKKEKPATLYFDEIRTPTYVDCLSDVVEAMLVSKDCGIFHCGGPRKSSLYQIAQIINRVGGYRPELLIGCPRSEAGPMPPRAGDVTMDSSKLRKALPHVAIAPWPLDPLHVPTDPLWHFDRKAGEQGSPEKLLKVLCAKPATGVF